MHLAYFHSELLVSLDRMHKEGGFLNSAPWRRLANHRPRGVEIGQV